MSEQQPPEPAGLEQYGSTRMDVQVVLDRRMLTIRELLEMRPGSIVRFTGPASRKAELYIGGARVASGEIVSAGGSISLRLTALGSKD